MFIVEEGEGRYIVGFFFFILIYREMVRMCRLYGRKIVDIEFIN